MAYLVWSLTYSNSSRLIIRYSLPLLSSPKQAERARVLCPPKTLLSGRKGCLCSSLGTELEWQL